MVLLNLECQKSNEGVYITMEVQGEKTHISTTISGQNLYEALGLLLDKLMKGQKINPEFKLTWVHSSPQTHELTVIQELRDGTAVDVRWGTNLFEDLFTPIYRHLKDL